MNITYIYESVSTDGYRRSGDGVYFKTYSDAEKFSKEKHGGYACEPSSIPCIEKDGLYYRLKSESPVTIFGSESNKKQMARTILGKLSAEELATVRKAILEEN